MAVFLSAEVGRFQRVGKLQQGLHLGRVKLMQRFQIVMHFGQALQAVNIHGLKIVPSGEFFCVLQKAFVQLAQKFFLCVLSRKNIYFSTSLFKF